MPKELTKTTNKGKKAENIGTPISTGPASTKKIPVAQELIDKLQREFPLAQSHIKCSNELCKTKGKINIMEGSSNPAFNPPTPLFQCTACHKKYAHTRIVELIIPALKVKTKQASKPTSSPYKKLDITGVTQTGSTNSDEEMDHDLEILTQVSDTLIEKPTEKSWAEQVEDLQQQTKLDHLDTSDDFLHLHPNMPDYIKELHKRQDATNKMVMQLTKALSQMANVIQENANLKLELATAKAQITVLKNNKQVHQLTTPTLTPKTLRPTIRILDNEEDGLEQSKHAPPPAQIKKIQNNYAAAAARGATKKTNKKRIIASKRAKEVAARHLTPVPESQGFQFIYVPYRHRMTIKAMRQILRTLRVDNSRILDVHFPDRQVAALLVHNDYANPLTEILEKEGVQVKKEFDPLNPSILRDQKLAELSDDERFEKVQELHHNNLIKALKFIREPVKFAVARDFHKNSWITANELTSFLPTYKSQEERTAEAKAKAKSLLSDNAPSRSPSPGGMEIDDDDTTGNTATHLTTSTSSNSN